MALSSPSLPALVEQGGGVGVDNVDADFKESPLQQIHRVLKNTLPGAGRDLHIQVS